jgi:hypothetical protein
MLPFSLAKIACLRVAVSRGGLLACTCGAGPARAVVRFSERFLMKFNVRFPVLAGKVETK